MLLLQEKIIILFKIISSLSRNGNIFLPVVEPLYETVWNSLAVVCNRCWTFINETNANQNNWEYS